MKKSLRLLALCLCALVSPLKAELLPYPTDTINGQIVYRYQVPKSIGLYRVSVNFGVTQEEIIKWNPQLKERGLHYAETILIPAKDIAPEVTKPVEAKPALDVSAMPEAPAVPEASEASAAPEAPVVQQDTVAVVPVDTVTAPADTVSLPADTVQALKIAVLLPLQADLALRDPGMERFVEFYEGVLLAVNDLQQTQPFELFVYDIGKTEMAINRLVEDSALYGMDAIIGPAYPTQVEALANFAKRDSVPVLIPFTNKVKNIGNNPFLMQFNPDVKNEAKALADYFEPYKDSVNFVFVDAKEADIPYSVREFRQAVRNRDMSVTRISVHDILTDSVSKAFKDSMENVIIFNTEKFSNLQLLLPHVLNGKAGHHVTMYSQYSWQKEKILLPQIYTSVFATDVPADLAHYESMFDTYFKHEHGTDLPRFDLLGYDITRQLVAWLQGKEYFGLQSDMKFEKVSEEGGYINTKVAVIRK